MAIALRYAARSDLGLGPKSRNEDSGYAGAHLLVLADGMGGHAAGDVASSMIVGELAPLDDENVSAEQAISRLEDALRRANVKLTRAMKDNADLAGMGSTTIALLRTGNKVALAHIGDSRAFLLRGDSFAQITTDHSFVQQLVDEGRITREEASHHPQRSVVTRVMTGHPDDEPDTSLREAKVGDRYLLCSDGLSDFVGAEVIEEILRAAATPDDAAERCIEVALKASTRDNVTVIVADVVDAHGDDLPSTVPQIVGAAGRRLRDKTRPIPTSPAAKAAALTREVTQRDDDTDHSDSALLAEDGRRSTRRRRTRRVVGGGLIVVVIVAGGYAAYDWTQRQYFVAPDGTTVAIFRGVSSDLGPIQLSHVADASNVLVSDLPTNIQAALVATIPVKDLAEARAKVTTLRADAAACRALAASGTPCGTLGTTPTSLPTTPQTLTGTPVPSGSTSETPTVGGSTPPATGSVTVTVTVTVTHRTPFLSTPGPPPPMLVVP